MRRDARAVKVFLRRKKARRRIGFSAILLRILREEPSTPPLALAPPHVRRSSFAEFEPTPPVEMLVLHSFRKYRRYLREVDGAISRCNIVHNTVVVLP